MRLKHMITVIDSHTAGEPTRIVLDGFGHVTGDTMAARMTYLRDHLDWLRRALMREPRGHRDMFGAILLPPLDPRAHAAVVFMDGGRFYNMCGHATLGICAMLVETGRVAAAPGPNTVRLQVPAGVVEACVTLDDRDGVADVSFVDVPSYAWALDRTVEVPGFGEVTVDVGFGGNFFVIAEAARLGFDSVAPHRTDALITAGIALRDAADAQIPVQDPTAEHIRSIDLCMLTAPPSGSHADGRNIVICGDGQADRSPCGSGTCARLAVMHRRGQLAVGQTFRHESSIGSVFDACIVGQTRVGDMPAVLPRIRCRPFITGFHQFVIDPDDPFAGGFSLTDINGS